MWAAHCQADDDASDRGRMPGRAVARPGNASRELGPASLNRSGDREGVGWGSLIKRQKTMFTKPWQAW